MDWLLCFVDIRFSHDLELDLDSFPIGDVDFASSLAVGLDGLEEVGVGKRQSIFSRRQSESKGTVHFDILYLNCTAAERSCGAADRERHSVVP